MSSFSSSLSKFKKLNNKDQRLGDITQGSAIEYYFQINTTPSGLMLQIIDRKGKILTPGKDLFSLDTHGPERAIIAEIEKAFFNNHDDFDWFEKTELEQGGVFLSQIEQILPSLISTQKLIDKNWEPYSLKLEEQKVCLHLENQEGSKEKTFKSYLTLLPEGLVLDVVDWHSATRTLLLINDYFQTCHNLGPNFQGLKLLETKISEEELNQFLSIFFSNFENIDLKFNDFQVVNSAAQHTKACLFFEKVDAEQSLYIRPGQVIPDFPPSFLEEMPVSKIANVNYEKSLIFVHDLVTIKIGQKYRELVKLLRRVSSDLKDKEYGSFIEESGNLILEKDLAQEVLEKYLGSIMDEFILVGTDKLKEFQITTISPKLNLKLNHGIDFLTGSATVTIEDEDLDLFDVIKQVKRNSYVLLSSGKKALLNDSYINRLKRLVGKEGKEAKISFFDLPAVEEIIDGKTSLEPFHQYKSFFLGFENLNPKEFQFPNINAELRPYQQYGVCWLNYLHRYGLSGCLADDMGLGKTLQTITLLSIFYPHKKKPSLIIMPKSLLYNWQKEIQKFNPSLSFYVYYESQREMVQALKKNLVLTTYGMIRNNIEAFQKQDFFYVVLDESQNIKNPNSQISKAVNLLNSAHRIALSGTPIENNLFELYSLFRFLNPSMFGSINDFNQKYVLEAQRVDNHYVFQELRKKTHPFILRRLKKDVLQELPERMDHSYLIQMSSTQKKLYEKRREMYREMITERVEEEGMEKAQAFIFQALTELRQLASIPEVKSNGKILSPKREWLINSITDAVSNDHKVLVFTNFLDAIQVISDDLNHLKIKHLTMSGSTRRRQELVDQFQNDPDIKVFILSLKVGGTGLNLTKADLVYIFDPWWNTAAENQAIDRAHRIGQENEVFSYRLIAAESIEEKIAQLQKQKNLLLDSIISSDSSSTKKITQDDLDYIFS